MCSLYLEPADLILLIAKSKPLKQEQIHFHISYYQGISTLHKKSESNLALAACSLLKNKPEETKHFLQSYSESSTPSLSYYSLLLHGLLYEKMELPQKSVEFYVSAYNEVHEKTKKTYLLFLHLIDCFFKAKSYSEAHDFFLKVSDIPQKIQTYIYAKLGYFCEVLSMDEKAIGWYSKIRNLDSSVSRACRVWLNYLEGRDILEMADFYKSIEPANDEVLFDWDYLRSFHFISKNELDKALEILKSISDGVKKEAYFSLLGYIYYKKTKMIQAFVNYLKALQRDTEKAENWYNLAVIYKKVDQIESIETLEKARSLGSHLKFETLTSTSDVIITKFDFSMFGKQPVFKQKKAVFRKQERDESAVGGGASPQVALPTAFNSSMSLPNIGISMPSINLFYEAMMGMWSPGAFSGGLVGGVPSFNFFANQPLNRSDGNEDPALPKKRNRENKNS